MLFVDAAGDVGVAPRTGYGGGAGVGVDPGEVIGRQGEAPVRVVDGGGAVKEEGALGGIETPARPAKYQGAELE